MNHKYFLLKLLKMKRLFLFLFVLGLNFHLFAQTHTASDADSKITFVIKNMGMDVNGSLKGLKGKINFDPQKLANSSFDMTVDVKTINTGIDKRDTHLKSADFFEAEKFPVINIKTTKILSKGSNKYFAYAVLTIKGVSKNIQFDFIATPQANGYTFTGGFPINRRDYGVGGSSMTMSDNLKVNLSVVAHK